MVNQNVAEAEIHGNTVRVSLTVPIRGQQAVPAEAEIEPQAEVAPREKPRSGASHSRGFETVTWFGRTFHFTPKQRAIVAILWGAWEEDEEGLGQVHQNNLLEDADSTTQRLRDLFNRGDHPAWGTMIVQAVIHGGRKGCYMLKVPDRQEVE